MKHRHRLAQSTVAVLGLIAAAISYDHIRHLADTHAETGWAAYALPLTIDGIEIIATLALLTHRQHQASRRLAWAMLTAGTLASIAANIAAAPPDPIARAIAAWPAAAFAAAIKLLTTLLDPPHQAEPDTTGSTDQPASTLRVPKTDRARENWNTIWNDHLATGNTATELAARHHISPRQARTILAAGQTGNLDPPPPHDPEDQPPARGERLPPLDE